MSSNPFAPPPPDDDNPFRPPTVQATTVAAQQMERIDVHGKYLIVPDGAVLPQICIKSNQPISPEEMQRKTYYWAPSWLILLVFCIGGFLAIIVYFVVRKRCRVTYGLSRSIRSNYRWRVAVKSAATLVTFAMFIGGIAADIPALGMIGIVLFFISLVSFLINNQAVYVAKYKGKRFWIKGCSPDYLARFEVEVVDAMVQLSPPS